MPSFIDTHIHLHTADYDTDRDAVIKRAQAVGVERFIAIGAGRSTLDAAAAVALTEQYDCIWASVGVHPHDAASKPNWAEIEKFVDNPRVVAIGETGLDYHYKFATKEEQFSCFEYQIRLACQINKPLIIHCREAAADCLQLLKDNHAKSCGGVFHCYSEDAAFALELAKLNFLISLPGIITFKNAQALRESVRQISLDQIMLETDGPYLSPIPYRGKRCESAYLVETAKVLASIKEIDLETVASVTTQNANRLFRLSKA
jgi:TatD DNase family protein